MSYKVRKKKYKCCNWILETLYDRNLKFENDIDINTDQASIPDTNLYDLVDEQSVYSRDEIYKSCRLLSTLEYIGFFKGSTEIFDFKINLFLKGEEAFLEGYFPKEIQKDFNETMDLNLKWILPIVSLGFSAVALVISILGYIYPRK